MGGWLDRLDSLEFGGIILSVVLQLEQVTLDSPLSAQPLLNQISFSLAPGEFVGIVGPSGAGKTSLLRLINRLQDASHGQIQVQHRPVSAWPVVSLRQQMALVLQEPKLLGMTVQEAMHYPLKLRGMAATEARKRVNHWLERLQIPRDWQGRTELELSVGQRQRVAIARALVTEPPLLLLDEPTSALDVGHGERLLACLQELATAQGMAILMANHQLDWVEQFCSRVLYLQQGKLGGDWPATVVNWHHLREAIADVERRAAAEWD
ncbi:ABC transporter protein [Halomicronema hongdechloris C2206]|uniref:ABC transporter protein n=1 Tax=Halomicronema hongdechloris C2206 TaxID=1641165 RepID=A0A1Z3HS46_9CYAN|nr:ATP-binding cassette domain-containing protein [Halomicronema hongdechloris]ASC72947.1 ABC transporter protein [Halomicronema hongdechloris C2206]